VLIWSPQETGLQPGIANRGIEVLFLARAEIFLFSAFSELTMGPTGSRIRHKCRNIHQLRNQQGLIPKRYLGLLSRRNPAETCIWPFPFLYKVYQRWTARRASL